MAQAYTSPINTQDPATAPDTYVMDFPDVNLKRVLNSVIASAMNEQRRRQGLPQDVVRTADQAITAGDMKVPVNMYGPLGLNSKNITNTEGLQFLVNAIRIDMVNNQVTDFTPLRDLDKLEELNIGRNPNSSLTDVRNAIQNLNNAINAAKVAEQARQAAADASLTTANTQKTPSSFADAQAKSIR